MHSCRKKFCCNLFEVIPYIYWTNNHGYCSADVATYKVAKIKTTGNQLQQPDQGVRMILSDFACTQQPKQLFLSHKILLQSLEVRPTFDVNDE